MTLSEEDRKRIEEEERVRADARIRAEEAARTKVEKEKKAKEQQGALGCLGIIVVLTLIFVFSNNDNDKKPSTPGAAPMEIARESDAHSFDVSDDGKEYSYSNGDRSLGVYVDDRFVSPSDTPESLVNWMAEQFFWVAKHHSRAERIHIGFHIPCHPGDPFGLSKDMVINAWLYEEDVATIRKFDSVNAWRDSAYPCELNGIRWNLDQEYDGAHWICPSPRTREGEQLYGRFRPRGAPFPSCP
jgi:hypothetical protein